MLPRARNPLRHTHKINLTVLQTLQEWMHQHLNSAGNRQYKKKKEVATSSAALWFTGKQRQRCQRVNKTLTI
ncbi:hypothetical protein GDO81_026984 [Engystomops pustulosus]|uniref:Uncharacterized protein n=1 Tax=Engystomops pustulosus TaxID=76066 RepID=A0AAV6YF38_ENGPU|nr:hypothetical protein GDO81_026984 [Engystomops pustulosus]